MQHTVAGTSRDDAIACMRDEFLAIYDDAARFEAIEAAAHAGDDAADGEVFVLVWRQLR